VRDGTVEPGGIVSSPDGKLWFVLGADDEKVVLRRLDDNKVMLSLLRGERYRQGEFPSPTFKPPLCESQERF
jgi:hypothetical protein